MNISELIPGIVAKLRNRTDMVPTIPGYIKKAVLDLTESYEFEELRTTGPVTNFIINVSEYPTGGSMCPFINQGDQRLTFVVSWFCYFDTSITVGQSTGLVLKYRQPRVVETMSKILGQPVAYTQVGRRLVVGFLPNTNYATFMRYQREHPFALGKSDDPDLIDIPSVNSWIYMPKDWQDIIEYASAEKACRDIGMNDIGDKYHQILYGYKDKWGNETPGLIMVRQSQQQRNSAYNERQIRPVVRRYCR